MDTSPSSINILELIAAPENSKILSISSTDSGIKCETAICQERDELIAEKNIPVKYAEFGQKIKIGNEMEISVLYPFENLEGKEVKDDNDASIIVKFTLNNNSYLLTGDAGFKVDKQLLDKNINLESEILKVSHHGSKHATSNEFLKSVKPEKAIVSSGKNSYGHPTEELLNRLKNINARIFRTDEIGDVIFYNAYTLFLLLKVPSCDIL